MKLVVGLGNVGKRYAHTRHNIGFMVVEQLLREYAQAPSATANAQNYGLKVSGWKSDSKLQAQIAKVELDTTDIILAKPQTMMNLSGDAVQRLMQKYRLKPADVWVIYDDLDVNFGRLRIRRSTSSGQQGIRSIIASIGTGFIHARMGIGINDRTTEPSEIYVLRPFSPEEEPFLMQNIHSAAKIIQAEIANENLNESTFELLAD